MESPPGLEKMQSWNQQDLALMQSLIYTIESEASYPNPHAPARIKQAGSELLKITNKELIFC